MHKKDFKILTLKCKWLMRLKATLVSWASRSPKGQFGMSLHKELKAQAVFCPPLRAVRV